MTGADSSGVVNRWIEAKLIKVGGEPRGIAITPNGKFAYVANQEGGVSVIRTDTNEVIEVPDGNKLIQVGTFPNGVAITPDGKFAYVVNTGGGVSVIDTATNKAIEVSDGNKLIDAGTFPEQISITPDGKFAYVTNFIGATVSVIDTLTHKAIEVPDGNGQIKAFPATTDHPTGVAITPDGKFVYVANGFEPDNGLAVIDTSTNQLVDVPDGNEPVKVGQAPRAVAITPDARFAYVANFGLDGAGKGVSVIDTATNKAIAVPDGEKLIQVGSDPDGVAITPDGKTAYVANLGGGVSVIDTATNQAIEVPDGNKLIKADGHATAVAITPDGKFAYVANIGVPIAGSGVSVIKTSTNEPIDVPDPNKVIKVGTVPRAISITPDGRFAYVVDEGSEGVAVIDTSTNEAIRLPDRKKLIEVGPNPDAIAITPDGRFAYVANFDGGVSVIDISTNRVIEVPDGEEIKVESGEPVAIAIAPGGHFAYVTNRRGGTTVIDTATNETIDVPDGNRTIKVGGEPIGIAITPDQAPMASFAPPVKAQAGVPVSFDASASADSDGRVASYAWDFGDGQTATLTTPTATNVFAAPGTYQVKLRVADAEGCSDGLAYTGQTALCSGSAGGRVTQTIEVGPEPPKVGPPPVRPSNLFSFGKLVLNRHKGTATLLVGLPGPGLVALQGRGIRTLEATSSGAGELKLAVRPTGPSLRQLRRVGRVKLRAEVTFTPRGGESAMQSKSVTLRRKPVARKHPS